MNRFSGWLLHAAGHDASRVRHLAEASRDADRRALRAEVAAEDERLRAHAESLAACRANVEDLHLESRAREHDRGGEPVRSRADDDRALGQRRDQDPRGSGNGVSTCSSWSRRCS